MTIHFERQITYLNRVGMMIVTIDLVPLAAVQSWVPQSATHEAPISIGESARSGITELSLENPYTQETQTISMSLLRESFVGQDFDNLYLNVEYRFRPLADQDPIYPSDAVAEMRSHGFSEDAIQELLEWERTIRRSNG
ncbi:MAG: hypothetical protein U0670_19855 [Anaerolineae bacterium]